ncbi:OmpA family protein [Nonlabens dokdonensis]|jgi:outer membrane protein OmpA-like peptidoglycan-associated protein|uniref:Outer membrane protein A n=2 Tax=Nonlabens dokdonensis TaxID=328515 RepID=L7WD03_NONDD|nr:OmpA family protein [Nonlabens dokdonensis]AGC78132.1 outer membrane protein A [Nonlabens dokdonensis DSW-6]PZX37192.1 OmpA family protein [Nonlabens dokdonensis]
MKKLVLSLVAIASASFAFAQDLPTNPEPGKCYVRCTTPDVYENETVSLEATPAYKKLKVVPATYETVTERVLVKEASKKLRVIPATYKTETRTYVKKQAGSTISVTPATFGKTTETIEVKPAYAQWEMSSVPPAECTSSNPDDCRYWCYKGYPAEFTTVSLTTLASDASFDRTPVPEQMGTYTVKVVDQPARVEEIEIPAEYANITKTVLKSDATTTEDVVPSTSKTVSRERLVSKGGLTVWSEVDCKLVEYNGLAINWRLGSATLTAADKSEIDAKLLSVMNSTAGSKVEVASHTDSRGSKTSNQSLSERRAQAVANYLMSKGINASRIVANGYGETRLKNRCADGVSCTEREHRANRRTEFRLINAGN